MTSSNHSLELDAKSKDIESLLGERRRYFVVPDFQRPYEWGEDEWDDLWNDLMDAMDHSTYHFLGQVILIGTNTERKEYRIIDGQQRLSTLSILLIVLREYFMETEGEDAASTFDDLIKTQEFDGDKRRRLELLKGTGDDKSYEQLYLGEPDAATGDIKSAYDYFNKKVSSLSHNEVEDLRQTILREVSIIKTVPRDISSAYRVFQTENNRGKELRAVDLIKSLVLEATAEEPETDTTAVKDAWIAILQDFETLFQAGAKRPLMHIIGLSEFKYPFHRNSQTKFIEDFQHTLNNELSEKGWSVERFTKWLHDESKTYLKANSINLDDDHKYNIDFSRLTGKELRLTGEVRVRSPHSGLVLHYLWKNDFSQERRERALRYAPVPTARLLLMEGRATSDRESAMYRMVQEATRGDTVPEAARKVCNDKTISDDMLELHVQRREFKDNNFTKLVLAKLENHMSGADRSIVSIEDVTTEYIAPRKAFQKDIRPWKGIFDNEEDRFEEFCGRIGNVTLVDSRPQTVASDNPFDEKAEEYASSDYQLTRNLTEHDEWGFEQIERRSEKLAEIVVDLWSLDGTRFG
jgi:hypothetical protein